MSDVLVVGAGQLGLMMAAAGARFGISVDRIDHVSGEILPGTSRTRIRMTTDEIVENYPVITAELEHLLGNEIVDRLRGNEAWINAEALALLPARDQQKTMLDQLNVATSPWQEISDPQDLEVAKIRLGNDLVVKSIRDGYDGKGQWIVSADLVDHIPDAVFGKIIAERKINFSREVSLVGARFTDGRCHFYSLVENYHQAGMLRYTLAPASSIESMQLDAEQMLKTVMENLDYVGVMAMECFDHNDQLIVNELAPRVHNSGHWTQAGADYSQFDLHLFSILGKAMPGPQRFATKSLMLNLIGCEWNPEWQTLAGIQCYWYGKSWRESRKLGHINIARSTVAELVDSCEQLMHTLDSFHQQLLARAIQRLTVELS
jgi:5-(carboxyamino)imidazole ribonucleotide synthase